MRILVVDDETDLARNIQKYLLLEQYVVDVCFSGEDALLKAADNKYDCVILDLNLPDMDGIEVCRTMRDDGKTMPIIMLTARHGTTNITTGLDSGADDYIEKPFALPVLLSRVRAVLRRNTTAVAPVITLGDLQIDTNQHKVSLSGSPVNLKPREYALLEYLAHNKGRALSRHELLAQVWGDDERLMFSQTLDVHIAYLRRKIGKDSIETVPGVGYMIPADHV